MDGIFGLLLEAHGLSLMEDNKGLLIVPMKLLWKHQIYQKPVRDPLPLEQVLLEISSKEKSPSASIVKNSKIRNF